jgi:hypothetical protein
LDWPHSLGSEAHLGDKVQLFLWVCMCVIMHTPSATANLTGIFSKLGPTMFRQLLRQILMQLFRSILVI